MSRVGAVVCASMQELLTVVVAVLLGKLVDSQMHVESLTAEVSMEFALHIIARILLRAVSTPPSEESPRLASGVFLFASCAGV